MKKIIKIAAVIIMVFAMTLVLTGCGNRDMFDTVKTYDYAIVSFPDGRSGQIEIKKWKDYDGEQIQIIADDGTVYLINSVNCVLVRR